MDVLIARFFYRGKLYETRKLNHGKYRKSKEQNVLLKLHQFVYPKTGAQNEHRLKTTDEIGGCS